MAWKLFSLFCQEIGFLGGGWVLLSSQKMKVCAVCCHMACFCGGWVLLSSQKMKVCAVCCHMACFCGGWVLLSSQKMKVCAACCHMALVFAIMYLYIYFFLSIPLLYFGLVSVNQMEWLVVHWYQHDLALSFFFFNKGNNIEGINSLKNLWLIFV